MAKNKLLSKKKSKRILVKTKKAAVILTPPLQKKAREKPKGRPVTCRMPDCRASFYKPEKQKAQWIKDKLPCPVCNSKYCCLPLQEKQLREFQDQYFESNRETKYLDSMYRILQPYAQSLGFKKYGSLMDQEEIFEFSHQAALLVVSSYYKDHTFKIEKSFGNYLKKRFLQIEIPKLKNRDKIYLSDQEGEEKADSHQTTYTSYNTFEGRESEEEIDAVKSVMRIVRKRNNLTESQNVVRLLSVYYFLINKKFDKFYQINKNITITHHDTMMNVKKYLTVNQ